MRVSTACLCFVASSKMLVTAVALSSRAAESVEIGECVGLFVKMGMSCAAFIGWKYRAQARVTRAYYRQLALPPGTGRESPSECPRGTIGHTASCKAREKTMPVIFRPISGCAVPGSSIRLSIDMQGGSEFVELKNQIRVLKCRPEPPWLSPPYAALERHKRLETSQRGPP